VAGIFEAGGGVFESEIWGYRSHIMQVYNRRMYSSATVKASSPEAVKALIAYVEGPSVQLTGMSEKDYFEKQTESTKPFLFLSYGLLIFMGIAAGFAVANNMFAMVAGRMREIAMLRAVGFSKRSILVSFLIESLMLALVGGVLGCAAAIPLQFMSQDMIGGNNTFTAVVFTFDVGPRILATSMTLALVLGVAGAVFPALRAARTPVVTALRQV
jgi:putative ABC transport system permease protein